MKNTIKNSFSVRYFIDCNAIIALARQFKNVDAAVKFAAKHYLSLVFCPTNDGHRYIVIKNGECTVWS